MGWGLAGLLTITFIVYLMQRHERILSLQAQVLRTRFALEGVLRQRRELVETWCTLCEERALLPERIGALRQSLVTIAQVTAKPNTGLRAKNRETLINEEKNLSRLIRETYALFLEGIQEDGPHKDFFQKYFQSLTQLEKEMWDAQELYNDSVGVFNQHLRGPGGWLFRRWEHLEPLPSLPFLGADSPRLSPA